MIFSMMIAKLLFNDRAYGDTFNVCSAESKTWGEIAQYYNKIAGLQAVWVDKEDYLKILSPEGKINGRWQLEYARLFRRITDNSKVLALTGLKQEELMPMYDGLKLEISNIPEGYTPPSDERAIRMDEYLKKHNMARGADETNVIALNDAGDGTLNPTLWPDEFVRHKIIDAVGDMFTASGVVCGKLESYKGSHALNNLVLKKLFSDSRNYDIVDKK